MRAVFNHYGLLTFLFLCPCVLAWQHGSTRPSEFGARGFFTQQFTTDISGTVVNATTGDSVQNARIALRGGTNASTYSVETDGAGHFALTGVPPGNYEVTVSRAGFLAYQSVATNSPAGPLLVRLIPQSVIIGQVMDEDGEPITGAKVQVAQAGTKRASLPRTTAVTNDLGEYRLYGLPPGEYYVSAMPASASSTMSRRVTDSAALENYIRTFYPRTTDKGTAHNIVLRPGDQVSNIDIQLIKSAPRIVNVVDLTAASPTFAEQPTPTASTGTAGSGMGLPDLPRTSSVSGRVVNAVSDEPVRHAEVMLLNMASGDGVPYTTDTDATGAFRVTRIEAGDYRLSVLRDGYLPSVGYSGGTGKVVSVKPRTEVSNVVVRVSPASVITGRVFGPDGDPACDMRVDAIRLGHARGHRQLRVLATANTDDRGQYRLHGLPPGNYYVQASAEEQSARTDVHGAHMRSRLQYVSSFYPRAADVFSAAEIGVTPGNQVAGIDIWTETRQAVTVRGRVVNSGANRVSRDTVVSLTADDTEGGISPVSKIADIKDSEGHFEIGDVVPGAYELSATLAAGNTQFEGSIPLEVRTVDLNNVQLQMNPAVNTSAVVRVTPADRIDVGRIRVFLEPENHLPTGAVAGRLRRDGTFLLPNVVPDAYSLKLFGTPETYYVSDIQVGDRSINGPAIDFSHGVLPLQVTLSAAGGTVTGSVVGPQQQSVSGAEVVLVPDVEHRTSYDLYKAVTTAKDGSFRIVGIAPGEYSLFAWPRVEADAYYDPDFLAAFEELGTRVVIQENSSARVVLALLATE